MENKKVVQLPVEYQIGNTKYSVKPIYGEAPNKETVEDKIRRLILSERGTSRISHNPQTRDILNTGRRTCYNILVKAFVWRRERRNNESPVKHHYCSLLPPVP